MLDQLADGVAIGSAIGHRLPGLEGGLHAVPQSQQFGDFLLDVIQALFEHLTHHRAGRVMIVGAMQDGLDFRQREAELAGLAGEAQPAQVVSVELLVVVGRVTARVKQAFPGVIADRVGAGAGGLGEFVDLHGQSSSQSGGRHRPLDEDTLKPVSYSWVKGQE